jgi:AraC-like DNA-binding protein
MDFVMRQFTTDSVQQQSRFEYWRELVASEFVDLDFTRNERGVFFGSLATHQVGLNRLLLVESTSQRVIRAPDRAVGASADFYALNYLVDGNGCVTQNDNSRAVAAGEFFLFDLAAPGELELAGDFQILTLSLPRALVDRHIARAGCLCAVPVSTRQPGPGRVSMDMLQSLARNCLQMSDDDVRPLVEGLVRVTAAAFGSLPPASLSSPAANSALLTNIRNYVLCHLDEEDLSPCRIAAAHGLSERQVAKLFEPEEITLSRWLWSQRLDEARRMLSATDFAERTIKEIAHACGFKDISHFSSAFKTRFGCSPRHYRRPRPLESPN